jgi:peroxiredoxin
LKKYHLKPLEFLKHIETQHGDNLWDLSFQKPVLLVLLRHFGCVFCKEALTELGKSIERINQLNAHLVLVHLSDKETAETILKQFGLGHTDYVTDPEAKVYQQFGLLKGELRQLIGLKVWLRTLQQGVIKGHGLNTQFIGDGFQMPGVFLLYEGTIRDQFIHQTIADKPDYLKMAACPECIPA